MENDAMPSPTSRGARRFELMLMFVSDVPMLCPGARSYPTII